LSHYCTQIETEVGGAFFPSNCEGFNKEALNWPNWAALIGKLAFLQFFLAKNTEPLHDLAKKQI